MNEYLIVKTLHILSATVLFGTGIGIAFNKWINDRSGDVRAIRTSNEQTVIADWLFTAPAGIVQLATGLRLAALAGYSVFEGWLFIALMLFLFALACWLPVVWLQYRMRDLARIAQMSNLALPAQYWRYACIWFWLGVPAFCALVVVFWLMVSKP